MRNPKVSIITVTYNAEKLLDQTIRSVVDQSYENIQYIIIDGGSNDSTLEIVHRYLDYIDVIISEPDNGISDAFNKGIVQSTGDLVFILSADDFLSNNDVILKVAEYYSNNNDIDVIHGNVFMLDEQDRSVVLSKPDSTLKSCFFGQPLKHGGTFIAKKAYLNYGKYSENFKYAMDYELVLRYICAGAKFKYIDECIAYIRCGGVNQVYRRETIKESRLISINYGLPVWKSNVFGFWKSTKDFLKLCLSGMRLNVLLALYRLFKNSI